MHLAVLLIHYRTPELARCAIEALRSDLGGSETDVEWIVVDNGNDAPGRRLLGSLGVRVLDPGRNLGYAGGVNLGVERSSAPLILILNPDVLVLPGCTHTLRQALCDGAAVAGPRFFWDREQRFLLPPPESRDRRSEVASRLAWRNERWAHLARRRWRRHAGRHWRARESFASSALSGALLLTQRRVFQTVGPFDEGFRLYFEETDWLLRLRRRGLEARFVPTAEALHLHARSAAREPKARDWFAASAKLFCRRHYGQGFAGFLEWLESRSRAPRRPTYLPPGVPRLSLDKLSSGPSWVEVSPTAVGFPAAAEWVTASEAGSWRLPGEIWQRLEAGEYRIQVVNHGGKECFHASFVKPS